MTEIPEHLLRRSRERRAALGGGGDAGGGDEAPAASAAPAESSGTAVEPAAAAAAPAAAAPAAAVPAVVEEELSPMLVADQAIRRSRIPIWAAPVLLILPFWALLYAGAFGERAHEEVINPAALYATNCAGCHGGQGQGGSGPALAGGETAKTFPDEADHTAWVEEGSLGKAKGTPYGAADREGGQRTVTVGAMPGFASTLSPDEIAAIVQFEREEL